MKYEKYVNQKKTSQTEKIPGKNQVKNNAGGFVFSVDCWTKLDRFLILGTEGGSYYATEKTLTKEMAKGVEECIKTDGVRAVCRIAEISNSNRAPKNDAAIFALAMASKIGDDDTRRAARNNLFQVCRTGTHLFAFARAVEAFGGWGRGTRNAIASWYTNMPVERLMYQVVKYQQRDGWSHRDLLRLSHAKTGDEKRNAVFKWIVKGDDKNDTKRSLLEGTIIHGFEQAKCASSASEVISLVNNFALPHECVPTQLKNDKSVQEALLEHMPMTAMIRNLGNMSKSELLVPLSKATGKVIKRLGSDEELRKARIHPIQILSALMTYKSGRGFRGSGTWTPVASIVSALNDAFYASFKYVEPTGKRILLALDVSASMAAGEIAGVPGLSPRVGSAAMAMAIARVEKNFEVVAFTSGQKNEWHSGQRTSWGMGGISPVSITPSESLDAVIQKTAALPMGGTDCALPMLYASAKKLDVDAFIVITDNETWAGSTHPVQALQDYRRTSGNAAKLIVVGMVSNEFTIADPSDSGMLDVVGFDANAPAIISDFIK